MLFLIIRRLIAFYQHKSHDKNRFDKGIETADWYLHILERFGKEKSSKYAHILKCRGFLCYLKGDYIHFCNNVNRALAIAEENNYEYEKALCYGVLALYLDQQEGDQTKAIEYDQMAIKIFEKLDKNKDLAKILLHLGSLYALENTVESIEKAQLCYAKVEILTRDIRVKINCLIQRAKLERKRSKCGDAKLIISKALILAKNNNFLNEIGDCYLELVEFVEGEDQKLRYLKKAKGIFENHGYVDKAKRVQRQIDKISQI